MNHLKNKAVIVSGYFNPIHKGHLELFRKAKELSDMLIVIVNSDLQRELKGSKEFQDEKERLEIIESIRYVDFALLSRDKDKTQNATLKYLAERFSDTHFLSFANGGDQSNDTIPEAETCKNVNINLIDGLGDKIQSSSWLLDKK